MYVECFLSAQRLAAAVNPASQLANDAGMSDGDIAAQCVYLLVEGGDGAPREFAPGEQAVPQEDGPTGAGTDVEHMLTFGGEMTKAIAELSAAVSGDSVASDFARAFSL